MNEFKADRGRLYVSQCPRGRRENEYSKIKMGGKDPGRVLFLAPSLLVTLCGLGRYSARYNGDNLLSQTEDQMRNCLKSLTQCLR